MDLVSKMFKQDADNLPDWVILSPLYLQLESHRPSSRAPRWKPYSIYTTNSAVEAVFPLHHSLGGGHWTLLQMEPKERILYITRVGGGKSAIFILPAFGITSMVVIVVQPLIHKTEMRGSGHQDHGVGQPAKENSHKDSNNPPAGIFLVNGEKIEHRQWAAFVNELVQRELHCVGPGALVMEHPIEEVPFLGPFLEKKVVQVSSAKNMRQLQKHKDVDAWETNRMLTSGVAQRIFGQDDFEDDNKGTRVHLPVHEGTSICIMRGQENRRGYLIL
ncbi:hypothetical protein V8F06_001825 [Rhypophila decipiens]